MCSGTAATIPVTRVVETVRVQRDHVYVISPNTSLRMSDGLLTVSDTLRREERRAPVDIFFRTLADTHGPRAVCIVLSGTGPNGSNGLKRVKEHGGFVIAQDPSECGHDDMPRNAIATGFVDNVLRVGEMPGRLLALARQLGPGSRETTQPSAEVAVEPLPDILMLVRLRTGQDFSHYKPGTVLRRIDRRRHLHQLPDLTAYARFLREHQDEVQALQRELLISVTHFFRDADAFAALERNIIPGLFHGKVSQDQVRVWAAGCATGEEAYSVAMLLAEFAHRAADPPSTQVFATDLDEAAIAEARDGFYTEADVADVSPERIRRFFTREVGGYRVRRELRETVLFAHHNVLKDPPFSHLDLVCCRNLLIYLNRAAQERPIRTFHFALKPGGLPLPRLLRVARRHRRPLRNRGQGGAHLRRPHRSHPADAAAGRSHGRDRAGVSTPQGRAHARVTERIFERRSPPAAPRAVRATIDSGERRTPGHPRVGACR